MPRNEREPTEDEPPGAEPGTPAPSPGRLRRLHRAIQDFLDSPGDVPMFGGVPYSGAQIRRDRAEREKRKAQGKL